ncbi:MAG: hypothetical protein KBA99_05760 [Bacteroidia bacterium]|jgi:hypothetical protein|nr:hypothetical protein [Bacteroidia bacterium]
MEFKVLIYIVIGIIWLFSKLLSAKGKQKEGKSVLPESWTKPFEDQIETIKTEVRERKKIKHQEKGKNVRSSVITNSEKTNNIEGGLKAKNNLEKDEIMVSQVQILEEIDESGVNEMAHELSYEIRNGKIDWKRAVVINELLKHQHFR